MYTSSLLKAAIAGLVSTGAWANEYPAFAEAMLVDGSDFGWEAIPVVSETGYETVLFRITDDETGAPLEDTKGPVLLLHGMFSSPEDWLKRSDIDAQSTAIQLALAGYDVWIGCTRGRPDTLGHTTLNPAESAEDNKAYWDFSFEQVGNEDVDSMIDMIIAERHDSTCSKVTLVTHSSAANSALALATNPEKNIAERVDRIVTLAPCLQLNIFEFWLPLKDLASVAAFYQIIDE